jgi:hypothetical protein
MLAIMESANIERTLCAIRDRSAAIAYVAEQAARSAEAPEPAALRGVADIAASVQELAKQVIGALDLVTLDSSLAVKPGARGRRTV